MLAVRPLGDIGSSIMSADSPSPSPSPPPSQVVNWLSSPFSEHFKSQPNFLHHISQPNGRVATPASAILGSQHASADGRIDYDSHEEEEGEEELMLPPASQFGGLRQHSAHTLTPTHSHHAEQSPANSPSSSTGNLGRRAEATPSPLAATRLSPSPAPSPPASPLATHQAEQGDSSVEFVASTLNAPPAAVDQADTSVEFIAAKKVTAAKSQPEEAYTGSYKLTLLSAPFPRAAAQAGTSSAGASAKPVVADKPAPARRRPRPKASAALAPSASALAGPSDLSVPPPTAALVAPRKRGRPTKKQKQAEAEEAAKKAQAWIESDSSSDDEAGRKKRKGKDKEVETNGKDAEKKELEGAKPNVKKKKAEKVEDDGYEDLRKFPPSRLALLMTCPLCAFSLMDVKTTTSKRTHLVRCAPKSGLTPEAALYALLHEEKRLLTRERARQRKAEQERSMWDRLIATAPGELNKPKKQRKANPLQRGIKAVELDRNELKSAKESIEAVHERLVALFGKIEDEEEEIRSVNVPESQKAALQQEQQAMKPPPPLLVGVQLGARRTPARRNFGKSKLALRPFPRHRRGLGLEPTSVEALFTGGDVFGRVVAARYARAE